jgi:dihydrofolate reductase
MGKLTVTSFVTLDGVMQAPGGPQEDRSGGFLHGGWVMPLFDEQGGRFMSTVFARATAFLLGRGTYDIFAGYWPKVHNDADPIAGPLNQLPKYVVSRTLTSAEWRETTVLRDVRDVEKLKKSGTGELQVHGSPGLVQSLLAYELIDELNLVQFPLVLGRGKRLFAQGTLPTAFELTQSSATSKGVLISTLRFSGRPAYGSPPPPEALVAS